MAGPLIGVGGGVKGQAIKEKEKNFFFAASLIARRYKYPDPGGSEAEGKSPIDDYIF